MRRLGRRLLLSSCLSLPAAAPDTGGIGFTRRPGNRLPLDLPLVASDGRAGPRARQQADRKVLRLMAGLTLVPLAVSLLAPRRRRPA